MTIDVDRLLNWPFRDIVQRYDHRDTILYALSLGIGADPTDRDQLRFVYERELEAFPTMAVVLGYPGPWVADPDSGIDAAKVVFGEQRLTMHRRLPASGVIRARERVTGVVDKGVGRGALVYVQRRIVDDEDGALLATVDGTLFCRADGGFGGPDGPVRNVHAMPSTPPDRVTRIATLPQAALLYRLNGDRNPLHVDPEVARSAGFPRPILHGLCTYAIAAHAVLAVHADSSPSRLRSFDARFTAPVYPGEMLSVEAWKNGDAVAFRLWVPERNVKVLDNGRAVIAAAS